MGALLKVPICDAPQEVIDDIIAALFDSRQGVWIRYAAEILTLIPSSLLVSRVEASDQSTVPPLNRAYIDFVLAMHGNQMSADRLADLTTDKLRASGRPFFVAQSDDENAIAQIHLTLLNRFAERISDSRLAWLRTCLAAYQHSDRYLRALDFRLYVANELKQHRLYNVFARYFGIQDEYTGAVLFVPPGWFLTEFEKECTSRQMTQIAEEQEWACQQLAEKRSPEVLARLGLTLSNYYDIPNADLNWRGLLSGWLADVTRFRQPLTLGYQAGLVTRSIGIG